MVTSNKELAGGMMRLIRERLNGFEVPNEVQRALRDDLFALVNKPSKKKHGAAVMTPDASLEADLIQQGQKLPPGAGRPKIV